MEMILSGSDLYLVYVAGHRLKSNLEACTSVWASVVISIPDCLRLMYLGYLNKYVCLRLRPKKKKTLVTVIFGIETKLVKRCETLLKMHCTGIKLNNLEGRVSTNLSPYPPTSEQSLPSCVVFSVALGNLFRCQQQQAA